MHYFKRLKTEKDDYVVKYNMDFNSEEELQDIFNDVMSRGILDLIRNSKRVVFVGNDELSWMEYSIYARLIKGLKIKNAPIEVETIDRESVTLTDAEREEGLKFLEGAKLTYFTNLSSGKKAIVQDGSLYTSLGEKDTVETTSSNRLEDELVVPSEEIKERELAFILNELSICTENNDKKALLYWSKRLLILKTSKVVSVQTESPIKSSEEYEETLKFFQSKLEEAEEMEDYESMAYWKQKIELLERDFAKDKNI